MTDSIMNIGILGLGRIGKIHLENALNFGSNVRVIAAADPNPGLRAFANQRKVEHFTLDAEELLQIDSMDAVLICSPTTTHFDLINSAARQGLDIFCEKPVDTSLSQMNKIEGLLKQTGVRLQVGFQRRFDANFRGIKNALDQGRIGVPHLVLVTSRDPAPPPLEFIGTSGGLFMDMMIHDFDMVHFLLEQPAVEVYARGAVRVDPAIGKAGDIDTAMVVMKMQDETLVHINNSRKAVYGYDQRVEIFGNNGMITTSNSRPDDVSIHTAEGATLTPPHYFFLERYAQAYRDELYGFFESILKGDEPEVGLGDAYQATATAMAAGRSLVEGRVIKLSEITVERD